MRTCPACGKENEDNVTRCATCDEEIGAGAAAKASEDDPSLSTLKVDAHEIFAAAAAQATSTEDLTKGTDGKSSEAKSEAKAESKEPAPASNHVATAVTEQVPSEKPAGEADAPVASPRPPAPPPVGEKVGAGVVAGDTARAGGQMTVQVPVEQMRAPGGNLVFAPGTIKLVVEQGMSVNKEYLLNDPELIIGRRDPEQEFIPDIDLFDQENANNRYISRRQARLFFQEGHLFVEDLDSSNGTCVNNRPIKPNMSVQLNSGDKLLLGQSVMFRIRPMTTS
ncbi:MAG TPA: FHA domain-containing protein [Candidatus Xenobia bacterium]|jgi:hypothetical protein